MPKRGKKISLNDLKKSICEQKHASPKRRGRSRERNQERSFSRGSSCGSFSEGPMMDVEAIFDALHSCESKDDVILSTTLLGNGVLPEFLDWALQAYAAIERKRAKTEKKNVD